MDTETQVAKHYTSGQLFANLMRGLQMAGKDPAHLTMEDLAPVDEFHVGGAQSTIALADQMGLQSGMRLLDVGCGIGGPARLIAAHYQCRVDGIDLTEEFVEVGNKLSEALHLGGSVKLHAGSALNLPFEPATFDRAYMIHVGMNIADKLGVYREVRRVLKPAGIFAIFDILRMKDGALSFPLPWADSQETSFVADPAHYRHTLTSAGFRILSERGLLQFGLQFTEEMAARVRQDAPPALGLHLLMGTKAPLLMKNIGGMMREGILAPVELTAQSI